ncbi:MAG: hypothetical protein ABI855_11755, partial [Bacteroidota bacterium]
LFESGRESFAWASLLSKLNDNPKVQIFFFDVTEGEGRLYERDNRMYLKIKNQFRKHPDWKMITLSGNAHNMISPDGNTMASYLKQDKELNLFAKICALDHHYLKGSCRANFGNGLEEKQLGHPESVYDTTFSFDKYLLLMPEELVSPYTGVYYTKYITPAKMVSH